MINLNIDINGNGTKEQIIQSLKDVIASMEDIPEEDLDDINWEDPYLFTSIYH